MVLTTKDIAALMTAIRGAGYRQFHLRGEDFVLEIDRTADLETVQAAPAPRGADAPAADTGEPASPVAREGLVPIVAPMTGTFYRAPEPGARPFVEVGEKVGASDVVCIIEVMKLFSSIRAGTAGTVVEICAANETPVEAGAAVLWLEPAMGED